MSKLKTNNENGNKPIKEVSLAIKLGFYAGLAIWTGYTVVDALEKNSMFYRGKEVVAESSGFNSGLFLWGGACALFVYLFIDECVRHIIRNKKK